MSSITEILKNDFREFSLLKKRCMKTNQFESVTAFMTETRNNDCCKFRDALGEAQKFELENLFRESHSTC